MLMTFLCRYVSRNESFTYTQFSVPLPMYINSTAVSSTSLYITKVPDAQPNNS